MAKKAKKRRYSRGASKKVGRAMKKRKSGTLRSGRSGKKVKSKKQAIAIGLSEARKRGAKVPKKGSKKVEKVLRRSIRPAQVGGRISYHPVVQQFVSEIIERTKSIALGSSGERGFAVTRECLFCCHRSVPLRGRPPVRSLGIERCAVGGGSCNP